LHQRIELFRDSIGDLEVILGERTEQILLNLFNPLLSDEEREARAEEMSHAILMNRAQQEDLETQAINLVAFSDFILSSIKESRLIGRWLTPDELKCLVEDHLHRNFQGSSVRAVGEPVAFEMNLSPEGQERFHRFRLHDKQGGSTRLDTATTPTRCVFDARKVKELDGKTELIDPMHPLIRWIVNECEDGPTPHPAVAISLPASSAEFSPGLHAFVIHKWRLEGLRNEARMVYMAHSVQDALPMDESHSERLVTAALFRGQDWPNAMNRIADFSRVVELIKRCDHALFDAFETARELFIAENEDRCNVQQRSANRFAQRRLAMLQERIQRFEASGNARMIPATKGLLRKAEMELIAKQERILKKRKVDASQLPVCAGVIYVT
jgi:hypothetical protein